MTEDNKNTEKQCDIHVVVKSFYCLKKEGVIEEHEICEKQCSYCKMEKSLQ